MRNTYASVLCKKKYFPPKNMAKEQAKGRETTCCVEVLSKLNIGRHPNKQQCNLPNSPETKRDKTKDARKKSLDEVSAEQTTCILT